MGRKKVSVLSAIVTLILVSPVIVLPVSAIDNGQVLIDQNSVVVRDTYSFWDDSTIVDFNVVELGFGQANISILYTHESLNGQNLNSSNSQHSLLDNQTLSLVHELNDIPLGYSNLIITLYGDVGTNSENFNDEITITVYRKMPLEVGIGSNNSFMFEGYESNSHTGELPRDGESLSIGFPVINTGDVDWQGNLTIQFAQGDLVESLRINNTYNASSTNMVLVETSNSWLEGNVTLNIELENLSDSDNSNNFKQIIVPIEEAKSPILRLNLTYLPEQIDLTTTVEWNLSASNIADVAYNGYVNCSWADDTNVYSEQVEIGNTTTETFSFTTSAIPSDMTCYFSTDNLSKYSETSVEVSLDFESGMIESASEDAPSIMGGPWYEGDELIFSLLIRNIGESEGNARLYVVINDVYYYGDYLQLEPNSAGEIMLTMDSLNPGQYSIGWGISSFDSRITSLNSSELTFSVFERQSINLEIVDLDWKVNGLEATITANLDSYRERNVDLIFSDYNLDSAGLNEIFRVPVTLGSASQTFTINLGEQTGRAIHLSASGVDWQEQQNWGVYLEYQPRSYGYYMNFADFPNPKNPVEGSEAIVSISVTSTGDLDISDTLFIISENGTILSSQDISVSGTDTFDIPIIWPQGEKVTLKAYLSDGVSDYSKTYEVVIIEESNVEIPWNGIIGGLVASTLIFLVVRVATNQRVGSDFSSSKTEEVSKTPSEERVEISCPECSQSLRVPFDYKGNVKCPACDHKFPVEPEASETKTEEIAEEKTKDSGKKEVACPDCGQRLKIPKTYEGSAKCPACSCVFSCKPDLE
ncbi:MAG: hypothetical protein CMB73_01455 [Euryarchaeota archaeon]|nr:hypothetical protein [Euryarchaeota archaeon]|tara:strand:- start:6170 stop:8611 length:2442 start_codon:yes stop_codon:yes gene_type:complete